MRPNQDDRNFRTVPVVGHFGIVGVHGVEALLVLQAEHKDDRIDPGGKLRGQKQEKQKSRNQNGAYFEVCQVLLFWASHTYGKVIDLSRRYDKSYNSASALYQTPFLLFFEIDSGFSLLFVFENPNPKGTLFFRCYKGGRVH